MRNSSASHHTARRRAPTRADIATLVALLLVVPLTRGLGRHTEAATGIRVYTLNQEQELDLQDRELRLRGPRGETVVRVQNRRAMVVNAVCANKLCQRMGPVASPGQSLVCIPNRVRVQMTGQAQDVDAITR